MEPNRVAAPAITTSQVKPKKSKTNFFMPYMAHTLKSAVDAREIRKQVSNSFINNSQWPVGKSGREI